MASVDEILAMAERDIGLPAYTPVPQAPAPNQLQSLADTPTRAPTDVELGLAQLRAMSPTAQLAADIEGRKLLLGEGYSFGILPKISAAGTALKEALYGQNLAQAFEQATTEQDILKEYVRQKELENNNLVLGISGPELAGGLMSPIGSLYTPTRVSAKAPLTEALLTRGLNVGKAAGTGAGAAGLQTFLSTPGLLEERLAASGDATATGALIGGALGGVGQAFSAATPKLQAYGKAARRSAIGATAADYKKTAGKRNFIPKEEGVYTLTQQGIDNVIDKGYLGDSFDPLVQSDNLNNSISTLEAQLDANIAKVDASGINVRTPQFINTVRQNQKGEFGGVNKAKYSAELARIKNDIASQRTNRLQYLQDQKKYYGTLYDPQGTTADAKFNRAIYHELQSAIENYVPDAKDINEEVQSLILTRPIIDRRKAEAGAIGNRLFNALARATYTTGGLFGAGARSAGLGPIVSAALAASTRGAATPTGRNVIGNALVGSSVLENALTNALRAAPLATRPDITPIGSEATQSESEAQPAQSSQLTEEQRQRLLKLKEKIGGNISSATSSKSVTIGKQEVSIPVGEGYAPPDLVKAVILAESGGDPEAVSEKGAAGLMQLMVGTARDLGLTSAERFVPNKNVKAGSRYLQRQIDKYGSIEAGLAAYNWGPANIATAISKLESDGLPVTWENIQKAVKVPSKTKAYINTVLKYLEA